MHIFFERTTGPFERSSSVVDVGYITQAAGSTSQTSHIPNSVFMRILLRSIIARISDIAGSIARKSDNVNLFFLWLRPFRPRLATMDSWHRHKKRLGPTDKALTRLGSGGRHRSIPLRSIPLVRMCEHDAYSRSRSLTPRQQKPHAGLEDGSAFRPLNQTASRLEGGGHIAILAMQLCCGKLGRPALNPKQPEPAPKINIGFEVKAHSRFYGYQCQALREQ